MARQIALGALSIERPQQRQLPRLREDRPAYMVAGKGFFNDKDRFLHPGQATYLDSEPNLDLIPLNKLAYDKMQEFLDKLDALGLKKNKNYIPIPRAVWNESTGFQDELPSPDSVMGVVRTGPDDTIF